MADGTVRGTFDLNMDPALRKVRALRTEGGRADETMRQLGRTMDKTAAQVGTSWDAMRRDVDTQAGRMEDRVDRLENRVQRFGRTRASATVDLNGYDKVNAQLIELERRLDRLSRVRSTPTVSLGGGFSNGVGGGGGGFTSAAGRSGGGGLGLAGKLAIGGASLLPGVQGLAVGSVGLLGSASGAALGAGALGIGGAGALAVGGGLTVAVAKPTIKGLQELAKEQAKYTQTIERYGRESKQAAVAREALNRAEAKQPGAAGALRSVSNFTRGFQNATRAGRRSVYEGIGNVAAAGRVATPALARAANLDAGATANAASNYAGYLASPAQLQMVTSLSREFARDMPIAERSLQNVTTTLGHLAVDARPFFHEGMLWVESWTHGLAAASGNEQRVQSTMRGLVNETKDWGRLSGATFRTIRDIFNMGRPSGDSMVVNLTETLDRWDSWIQRNPTKVRSFFTEAQHTTEGVASALTSIVHLLSQTATALTPIFNRATGLIRIVTALGPGVTTLGSAALYGAYGGFRGGSGAGGSRVGAVLRTGVLGSPYRGGGAGGAAAPGGGVLVGGAGSARMVGEGVYNVRPMSVVTRGGSGFIAGPGVARSRPSEVFSAANARDTGPFVSIAERENPLRGLGGRVANSRLGTAAGGAAKTIGATLAIMAALEAFGKGGSAGETVQNFGSSFTLGLLHPTDNSGAKGQARATTFLGGIPGNYSAAKAQSVVGRKIARVLGTGFVQNESFSEQFGNTEDEKARERKRTFHGVHLNPGSAAFPGEVGAQIRTLEAIPGGHAKDQVQELRQLLKTWQENKQAADQYRKARNEALDTKSIEHGERLSSQLGGAFKTETTHGASTTSAFGDVTGGALASMRSMREAGRKVLGENTLAWAKQLERANPELAGPVAKLTGRIKGMFHDLGRDVQIVNGHILTGSKEEWDNIATAMSEPLEKARERMSKSFTAIQEEAVGALVAMGFNRKGAIAVVSGMEKGGPSPGQIASKVTGGVGGAASAITGALGGKKNARGGMIDGNGLSDTVRVPGGMAAPGEGWIANRHTLRDMSAATVAMYGLTAQQMISNEHRMHSMPYARGGQLSGVRSGVRSVAESILGQFPGLSVTSTTGGTHAKNSLHYLGEAVDLAGDPATMLQAASWTGSTWGRSLAEGIHNPNLSIKSGKNISSSYWGAKTWAEHLNHIHVGVLGGGGARGAAAGTSGAGGGSRSVHLRGRSSGLAGVPGALADQASLLFATGLSSKVNKHLANTPGGGSLAGFHGGGTSSANEALGRRMMIAAGWGSSEWPSLKALWTQESGWNANSVNSSSGAYGIPQALGHGHPFALGDAPAQIAWGLNYIRGRYGSPAGAEAHERSFNWYQRGGRTPAWGGWNAAGGEFETRGPVIFGAGERGKERVSITPVGGSSTRGGHHIEVNIGSASFAAGADIDAVAREVAVRIMEEIDAVGADGSDKELIGR